MRTNKELVRFLKSLDTNAGFTDRLKIAYRPYICPFNELIDLVDSSSTVMDIGCGSGQFAALLAHFSSPSKIFGIEIDDRLVKNANLLFKNLNVSEPYKFQKFDGSVIPDEIAEYNTVFMIDVVHHIPLGIRDQFFEQLFSKISKGSRLIIKDINASSPLVYTNKLHDLVFAGEIGNELSLKQMSEKLSALGFSIVYKSTKTTYVYPHYTVIAKK